MGRDRQLRQCRKDWRDCNGDVIALPTTMVARLGEIALATMMLTCLSLLQQCNKQTEIDEIPTTTMMMMKAILVMTIMQQSNRKREREMMIMTMTIT